MIIKYGKLICLFVAIYSFNVYAISLDKDQKKTQLEKLNIELVHSTNRTGEAVDYLLCRDNCSDESLENRKQLLVSIRKISDNFELYDDKNVLELHWFAWGSAYESKEYYDKQKLLQERCICAMWKNYIGSSADVEQKIDAGDITKTSYVFREYSENDMKSKPEACPVCNISNDEFKELQRLDNISKKLL